LFKRIAVIAGVLLCLGCSTEPEERLQARLDRFMALLNTNERDLIAQGQYDAAAAALGIRAEQGGEFARAWREILDGENILFFDYRRAVRFFAGAMDGRIRFLRFVNMLSEPELLAFNKASHAELARLLLARFEARPSLESEYRERVAPKREEQSEEAIRDELVWKKFVLPFVLLYRCMNEAERMMLIYGDAAAAARAFFGRRGSEPKVQQALEGIHTLLPETRGLELPVQAFDAASLASVQDRQARRALGDLAEGSNEGRSVGDALRQLEAMGVRFPEPGEREYRLGRLESDLAWFEDLVQEKINFFN